MKIIILGSGIIGTTTAWYLNQDGHEVTVIDRQPGAAQETSFANGGQISVSYSEPWASPAGLKKMLQWLGREDAPLLFRLRPEWRQWLWGLAFLRESLPHRVRRNIRAMVALSTYSRATLQALRAETGIEYDQLQRGILTFQSNAADLRQAQRAAALMRDYGVDRRMLSREEIFALEPALAHTRSPIVGGDYTADDESGDVYKFTTALAARAAQRGVQFHFNTQITRLLETANRSWGRRTIAGVEVIAADGSYDTLRADAYVVALGSYSPLLLHPLGVPCLVYPAKGYSATYAIVDAEKAPTISLTDSAHKIVITRLGNRLRVAGTAEFNGYSRALNPVRCAALNRRTEELFGDAVDHSQAHYWSGLRPATPSNVPLIGPTRFSNLYLNTGHGTLGWTMGCGSGKALADLLQGKEAEVEFPFLGRKKN
ncbi:MAG: D-amino acid dehydrogenase [Burkholderiaceae bacterium]|nr:MAG: D-amino acid dehydrogenase [Burkholderiaceae bacterium]